MEPNKTRINITIKQLNYGNNNKEYSKSRKLKKNKMARVVYDA
jgi:hypothetical protein